VIIHWADDDVEFIGPGISVHIRRVSHCAYCTGKVWIWQGDPDGFLYSTLEAATAAAKEHYTA
jgi:hypothetical protein